MLGQKKLTNIVSVLLVEVWKWKKEEMFSDIPTHTSLLASHNHEFLLHVLDFFLTT